MGDQYLESLYPPESNHLIGVSDLISDWFEFYLMKNKTQIIGSIGISFKHINPEIKRMFIEPGINNAGDDKDPFTVSDANTMLKYIKNI